MIDRDKQIQLMLAAAERRETPLSHWLNEPSMIAYFDRDLRAGPNGNGETHYDYEELRVACG